MMKEIKFRGKIIDSGEWIFGYYFSEIRGSVPMEECLFRVQEFYGGGTKCYWVNAIPETIGQYTGLKDKNGKEIYEGDIIRDIGDGCLNTPGVIKWSQEQDDFTYHCGFIVDWQEEIKRRPHLPWWTNNREIEIIGNIYENTELLKGTTS